MFRITAVITDAYINEPPWHIGSFELNPVVKLNSNSSPTDVGVFIAFLFDYNNLQVDDDVNCSFRQLIDAESLVVSGGPFFESDNKVIGPSCCCGLEELKDISLAIRHRTSPWLGHDPNPGIKYSKRGKVHIWSDDPDVMDDAYSIMCTYNELIIEWSNMCRELEVFFDVNCREYLAKLNLDDLDLIIKCLKEQFWIKV